MDELKTFGFGLLVVGAIAAFCGGIAWACANVPYFGASIFGVFMAFLFCFLCYACGLVYRGKL